MLVTLPSVLLTHILSFLRAADLGQAAITCQACASNLQNAIQTSAARLVLTLPSWHASLPTTLVLYYLQTVANWNARKASKARKSSNPWPYSLEDDSSHGRVLSHVLLALLQRPGRYRTVAIDGNEDGSTFRLPAHCCLHLSQLDQEGRGTLTPANDKAAAWGDNPDANVQLDVRERRKPQFLYQSLKGGAYDEWQPSGLPGANDEWQLKLIAPGQVFGVARLQGPTLLTTIDGDVAISRFTGHDCDGMAWLLRHDDGTNGVAEDVDDWRSDSDNSGDDDNEEGGDSDAVCGV